MSPGRERKRNYPSCYPPIPFADVAFANHPLAFRGFLVLLQWHPNRDLRILSSGQRPIRNHSGTSIIFPLYLSVIANITP